MPPLFQYIPESPSACLTCVAGWARAAATHDAVVWVSYEELKRDAPGTVRGLAQRLDIPCPEPVLAATVGASSFDAMRAQFAANDRKLMSRGIEPKKNHIRQGQMGSWRQSLRGALLEQFEERHARKMAELPLDYEFDFGDS